MQGITLQEVDGELVINVPDESTVIGRGQFLQVTDKRVSRSHAMLEVCEGKLYITPTHTNPCFLRTQASKDQKALTRDMKQLLDHGDEFGLLPDQFFYRVSYPHLNGSQRTEVKKEDIKSKEEGADLGEAVSNGVLKETKDKDKSYKKNTDEDLDISRETNNSDNKKLEEASESENDTKEKTASGKVTEEGHGDMTLPLKKKRSLPDWMVKVVESPTKVKPAAKKFKSAAVSKKQPGTKVTKPTSENDDDNGIDEEEEDYPHKGSKKSALKDSDDDFEEEPSDDDYVPEKTSRKRGGKSQKKKKTSDSEEDLSDEDDDDYSPKKSKSKTSKKSPKGKGGAKGKKAVSRPARNTPQRSRAKKRNSDEEEEEEEALPRRRHRKEEEEDESPLRRPQRAARQKRGSYVDDPMIEEALEDFASDDDNDANEDKDSDFMVEGEEESGSDWEKSANSSQKQKVSKSKNKGPPRGPTKRVAGKKKARRPSKARDNSDEDEDAMEDDEPYVPRPSKRRGGAVSHDSDESDEGGQKKKRRREPCQYGKKCYRKNPVHFRTYCHPGDSSYDEEDKDSSSPKEVSRKEKESRTSSEKPSRPQRSTAGTRLVTHGAVDGLPDDNDDGTQHTDESGADDSDYNIDEDVPVPARDSKKSQKNKKPAKAVGSD